MVLVRSTGGDDGKLSRLSVLTVVDACHTFEKRDGTVGIMLR